MRMWRWLSQVQLGGMALLACGAGTFAIGIAVWAGLHGAVAFTNTNAYCTSCHAMQVVTAEYHSSTHHGNHLGITATCADCHVPRAFGAALLHKLGSGPELLGTLRGSIDTPERFEAQREALATVTLAELRHSDSATCRSCHSPAAMTPATQSPAARAAHEQMGKASLTCVDCHAGLVHQLPAALRLARMSALQKVQLPASAAPVAPASPPAALPLCQSPAPSAAQARPKATSRFLAATASMFPAFDQNTAAGQALPGAPVTVLEQRGPRARVRLLGWRAQDALQQVFAMPLGRRIPVAQLTGAQSALWKALAASPATAAGSAGALTFWVDKEQLIADRAPLWAQAEKQYAQFCTPCHAGLTAEQRTAAQWASQDVPMRQLVQTDDATYRLILLYLEWNAQAEGPARP